MQINRMGTKTRYVYVKLGYFDISSIIWFYVSIHVFSFLDCVAYNVIAFHANLKSHLNNVPVNSTIKFENVQLNKGNGYDPKTGIFTAPEDGGVLIRLVIPVSSWGYGVHCCCCRQRWSRAYLHRNSTKQIHQYLRSSSLRTKKGK